MAYSEQLTNTIGTLKRFGDVGPVYKVVEADSFSAGEEPTLTISVLDTGETLRYPYSKFLADPRV